METLNVKTIFSRIQLVNPTMGVVSSLGSFVTQANRAVMESFRNDLQNYVEKGSIAYSILESGRDFLTEKQIWVIAFALQKNAQYCAELAEEIAREEAERRELEEYRKSKLKANKEASQNVLDAIKGEKLLLKNYYSWLKTSAFKREFYSKKYTMDSAMAFIECSKAC